MSRPRIVGVDPSLTRTGIAGDGWAVTIATGPRRGMDRLEYLRRHLLDYTRGADLVVIEGLAYNAHDTARQLAGLSWLIRYSLWRREIPCALVPPPNLKQFATGAGGGPRADKPAIVAAVRGWFAWFDGDHNAADAAVLCAMGHEHAGLPLVSLSHRNRSAMQGCDWPEVARG